MTQIWPIWTGQTWAVVSKYRGNAPQQGKIWLFQSQPTGSGSSFPTTLPRSYDVTSRQARNDEDKRGWSVFSQIPGFNHVTLWCGFYRLHRNRDRFTWVNPNHPHLGPPPSIGGGSIRKLDYFRVRDDKSGWIPDNYSDLRSEFQVSGSRN